MVLRVPLGGGCYSDLDGSGSNLDGSGSNLDESGLAGARTPKETCSHRNDGSEVPRVPLVPWFRGFHRNEGLAGSSSGSDGSGDDGSVSFEGCVFRCSIVSKSPFFSCSVVSVMFGTRTSSRGVGGCIIIINK